MRLRAQILIDIDAADFADAAVHQKRVEQLFGEVCSRYEQAKLEFRQRRQRPHRQTAARGGALHYTGSMSEYEE
jgi:hypothetical protein